METSVKTTITLELDKKEALWLKEIMQNSINCDYEDEREEDRVVRKSFWDALVDVEN